MQKRTRPRSRLPPVTLCCRLPPAAQPPRGVHAAQALLRPAGCSGSQQQRRRRRPPSTAASLLPLGDRDEDKEERLRRFRVMYDFDAWAAHRSVKRYWRHFIGLFRSRIVAGIALPILLVFLEATGVCWYETALRSGLLPATWRSIQVRAPMLFSLSSFALSLLLGFRTNQSIARFDEARRLWNTMINRCRDAMRQAVSYLGPQLPQQAALLGALSRWLQAFPWVLKNHVREHKHWQAELGDILEPSELEAVVASKHPPLLALQVITELLDRAPISAKQRLRIDGCVTDLSDVVGGCQRILNTPIPVSYTRHTCRYLTVWLFLLPLSIFNQCGWVTVFSSVVLAFFLLTIEEIGVTIEEPFNILPLAELNRGADVAQNLDRIDEVVALVDAATGSRRTAMQLAPAYPIE
ncbi:UPF0187 chloroplastic [Chlorella sorokiniana]|uniref:UPF0187 chloroplastic n=1 Tax=Chlorella sorokiniana TaxID=3076 RepID=A0A2P6TGM4_CHLSO|nr:UPF0187 chloroplastic [Chlorella sorokiniana]|eukprot:PRW33278.1 UPF0187 chloroplastic [Chlorella sorokiniana]